MKKFECLTCGKIFDTEDKIIMTAEFVGQGIFRCTTEDCSKERIGVLGFNVKRIDDVSDA